MTKMVTTRFHQKDEVDKTATAIWISEFSNGEGRKIKRIIEEQGISLDVAKDTLENQIPNKIKEVATEVEKRQKEVEVIENLGETPKYKKFKLQWIKYEKEIAVLNQQFKKATERLKPFKEEMEMHKQLKDLDKKKKELVMIQDEAEDVAKWERQFKEILEDLQLEQMK